MVPCKVCGETKFERRVLVTISESKVRPNINYELEYDSIQEMHYYCTNCGWEYLGVFGPDA